MLKTQFLQHCLYGLDIVRGAESVAALAFEVSSTTKFRFQTIHEHLVLTRQHLLLHCLEATGKHLRLVTTIYDWSALALPTASDNGLPSDNQP